MDGIGDISAYHGDFFLGGLKAQSLVIRENDALESEMVMEFALGALSRFAHAIAKVLPDTDRAYLDERLFDQWSNTLARLCIGVRRLGTGGAFLISPRPSLRKLHIGHVFEYERLRDAVVLDVQDQEYKSTVETTQWSGMRA